MRWGTSTIGEGLGQWLGQFCQRGDLDLVKSAAVVDLPPFRDRHASKREATVHSFQLRECTDRAKQQLEGVTGAVKAIHYGVRSKGGECPQRRILSSFGRGSVAVQEQAARLFVSDQDHDLSELPHVFMPRVQRDVGPRKGNPGHCGCEERIQRLGRCLRCESCIDEASQSLEHRVVSFFCLAHPTFSPEPAAN